MLKRSEGYFIYLIRKRFEFHHKGKKMKIYQTIFVVKGRVMENKFCSSSLNIFKTLDVSQQMWVPERGAVLKLGTNE